MKNDLEDKLKDSLAKGETHFVFIKKDGTLRHAVGTTNLDLVPEQDKQFASSEEEEKKERVGMVTYYDLEKNAWRCCKSENIVEIG